MVFDNNDAHKRQGAEPTYKRKKGFQPLQISWEPFMVDALFRSGNLHCNHGTDFMKAVGRLTHAIRKRYRDVPIILLTDSGFMDDQNFSFFEERLGIQYICAGKLYNDIKDYVEKLPLENFKLYNQSWNYVEFATKEQFPFEKMGMNRAYYYLMIISHFLYEVYKRDVTHDILPVVSYPNTFRRLVIDFAAKVVSTGSEIILKVTQTIYEKLNIQEIWRRCRAPQAVFVT